MAISLRRIKQCATLSAIVLATVPISGCFVRQPPSKSALDVGVNVPVGKSKSELTKLVDVNPLSGRLHRSADAYIGQVSPAIFNQLKYLPLIAPAYVPDNFSLVKYDIPASGYVLIYRNNSDQCFAIEYDTSKQLSAGNSVVIESSASGLVADSSVTEDGLIPAEIANAEVGGGPTGLSELSAAGAIAPNPTTARQSIREDSEPAVAEPVGDTLDFTVFDSPLFGPGQKLFYGDTAEKMAVLESAQPNQMTDSDDTALDFLASPEAAVPEASIATGEATAGAASPSKTTTAVASGQGSFVSQWLRSNEGAYRYISGSIVTQNYSAQNQCVSVSLEEGVKIVTSLTVLSADSTGALESNLTPPDDPEYLGEGSQN